MGKLTIAVLLAGLALAAPAAAKDGRQIQTVPGVAQLLAGGTRTMTLTVVDLSARGGAERARPVRGVRRCSPSRTWRRYRRVTAIGSPTDADGHSRLRVAVPASGRWRAELAVGPRFWDYPAVDFGEAAAATVRERGSSFPWIPVAAAGALALVLIGALGRRVHLRRIALD